jgi:phage terminase large subunit-like protein
MWDLSCLDWEERLRTGRSLVPSLPLFTAEAEQAVQFYNELKLPDVPGNPRMAEASGDWFRDIVAALFGSRDPILNARYIEEIFGLIPKKNSKTTNGAGLMVVALLMNVRPLAEFMFVGPTQAISDLAFSQAEGMIKLDPELDKRFHIKSHLKEIVDRLNGAKLKIKTFALDILTGPRPAGVFLDELHLLGKNPDAVKVIRQLRGGRQATPEGFLVIMTTQSDEPPAGAFRSELLMARAIRDGRITGTMLPVLFEFPEVIAKSKDKAWLDPRLWHMVLPNLGRSLRLDALVRDFDTEREKGEDAIRIWASQHLNIEIGLALRSDRWAGADYWEAAADRTLTLDELLARCDVVTAGIDGGGLDDLLGLALLGRERVTRRHLLWTHAWAHELALERRKSEAARWRDLEQAGDLTIVGALGDDVTEVVDIVERVFLLGLLPEKNAVGLDPVGIGQIVDELAARDIDGERVVGISQGWKLSGAIKTTERALAAGTLLHGGLALMDYAVGNAKAEPRGNATSITKAASGTGKIDPLMATFNAVALMSMNPTAAGHSVYEERGLRAV